MSEKDYAKGLDPLPGGEAPRPSENPGNFSEQQAAEFTVIQLQRDLDRLRVQNARLRECLVDLAEGWVGNVQQKAQKVLDR